MNKQQLKERTLIRELRNGGDLSEIAKLFRIQNEIPNAKFLKAAQYLENELLPRILKKQGKESAEYLRLCETVNALLWAIEVHDRYEFLLRSLQLERMQTKFYRERCADLENQLLKFSTLEDMYRGQALATIVRGQVNEFLNQKTNQHGS